MRKRIISWILVIAMLFSISMPIYASSSDNKQPISPYGDEMLEYLLTDNHKLLVIRNNYGYMQFADDFRQDVGSLYLLEMADILIETGSEPDKLKYMEVLINIISTYELDKAADISAQKSMDNLKSVEDYAMDIVDIGATAVSVMVGNDKAASKFEEAISTAIGRISTLKDNLNNWVEALSDLETIVENYNKHDAFLALIEQKADGELKEAASTLRSSMSKAFAIKLDTYADVSDKNFKNYGKMFFTDIFWSALKQTEDYEKDKTFKEFIDIGNGLVSKMELLNNSWDLGKKIGKLVGNVAVGGEDLVNRVLEIFALSDISAILQLEATEVATEFFEEIGTSEEAENVDKYEVLAQYLIGARIRGEYCLYSIVANDAGLLSWFNKKSAEEAEAWYEAKVGKILDIQADLSKIKKDEIDYNNFPKQEVEQALIGNWEIDSQKTMDENGVSMRELFGSGYSQYGSGMMIGTDNTFSYTIGIGNGGEGTYEIENESLNYQVARYEELGYETDSLRIMKTDNGIIYLIQEWTWDEIETYQLYWIKEGTDSISQIEKQEDNVGENKEINLEEICRVVENYYNTLYNTNIYVVFESEGVKTESGYFLMLRSQGEKEANRLVTGVSVNVNNGEVSDELNNNWNLYDYIQKDTDIKDDSSMKIPENFDSIIENIRECYYEIQNQLDTYSAEKQEHYERYISDSVMRKVILYPNEYENRDMTEEFYYDENGKTVFIFVYDDSNEFRYYFYNGLIYRYIDNEGKTTDYENGKDPYEVENAGKLYSQGELEKHYYYSY